MNKLKKSEIVDLLREKVNIVDYISQYVKLSKKGSEYVGKCPFHNDKNPSFYVSEDKWVYHCFGCGASGNLIVFVMNYHHLTFEEAVKHLLKYAGINNVNFEEYNDIQKQLFELNNFVQKILVNNINFAKAPKIYLKNRGLTDGMIKKYGLGYCSERQSNYLIKQVKKNFAEGIIKASGYLEPFLFGGRITIPLYDRNGKIVSFSGRLINDNKNKNDVKYINGHSSPIFEKGGFLYNLNNAKAGKTAVVVEGYFDVMMLDKIGINAVSINTSQVSIKQAKLLKRYFKQIILMLDGDEAGLNGMFQSLHSLMEYFETNNIKGVFLKDMDPADAVKQGVNMTQLINKADVLIDYYIQYVKSNPVKYTKDFLKLLNKLNIIEQRYYMQKFAKIMGINPDAVKRDMVKVLHKRYVSNVSKLDPFERIQRALITSCIKYPEIIDKVDIRFLKEPYKTMIQCIKTGNLEAPETFSKEYKDKWYSIIMNSKVIEEIEKKYAFDSVNSYNNYIEKFLTKTTERGDE